MSQRFLVRQSKYGWKVPTIISIITALDLLQNLIHSFSNLIYNLLHWAYLIVSGSEELIFNFSVDILVIDSPLSWLITSVIQRSSTYYRWKPPWKFIASIKKPPVSITRGNSLSIISADFSFSKSVYIKSFSNRILLALRSGYNVHIYTTPLSNFWTSSFALFKFKKLFSKMQPTNKRRFEGVDRDNTSNEAEFTYLDSGQFSLPQIQSLIHKIVQISTQYPDLSSLSSCLLYTSDAADE